MASSLQRMKTRRELERNPYYWFLFCHYYKWLWYRDKFAPTKFNKRSTLEKFYNDYCK